MQTQPTQPKVPSDLTSPVRTGWHPIQSTFNSIANLPARFCVTVAVLFLAALTPTRAGTFSSDFSTDPGGAALGRAKIDADVLKLQDLQEYIDATATLPMHGSYIIPQIDTDKVASFTATFKASIHGGTEQAAQGFSFVLANDLDPSLPFREGGSTTDNGSGFTTGLVISFDTVDNNAFFGANGNDPGDAPGIIVRVGGTTAIAKPYANLRTGPSGTNQIPTFVPVEIKLDPDGTLDVTYNGVKVYDNVPVPYIPLAGTFGFGAGTAELTAAIRANHWIDDLSITTTTVAPGSPVVTGISPPSRGARPDAIVQIQIEDLGAAALSMSFDGGASFTPSKVTVGNVSTVSYDPPGTLAPNSTHTVLLTYGAKTVSHSFKVLNATIIPAGFAATAGTVNTTTSGFKVRTHQLELAPPGGNTYQRSVNQLAGLLGPNIADLTVPPANADGTFNLTLVNMDSLAGESGFFNGTEGHADSTIPGIPNITVNFAYDYAAMEVAGFLDLPAGVYTFGLVSDDNARLVIGPDARDATGATLIDVASTGGTTSTILVDTNGIYPFRVIWGQGTGAAHLELWTIRADGTRVLLNDRLTTGHVKVYRDYAAGYVPPPYVSSAKPAPGEASVSTLPNIELAITEGGSTVDTNTIQLSLNSTPVSLPTGAISKSNNVVTISYNVTAQLVPLTEQSLHLQFNDSLGKTVIRDYTFVTGKGAGGGSFSGSQWDFDNGNLEATIGRDLNLIDNSLSSRYTFGTTTSYGIPDIGGKPAKVLYIPYVPTADTDGTGPIFKRIGLRANHNIAPNGGPLGTKVNQYTIIMDVLWGTEGPANFGSILQTHDFDNPTDGDMFWRASDGFYGKGCCSLYDAVPGVSGTNHVRGQWARVAFSVDLASSTRKLAKYVNGQLHRQDLTGDGNALNSRFGLPPEIFLFGDGDDNERTDCYVNSIQIREGAMTDAEVAALGGASAEGIPLPYAQWDFNKGNLAATVGPDLQLIDNSLSSRYTFGTTTSYGIPDIGDKPANVLYIPYVPTADTDGTGPIFKRIGLRTQHGLGANGGGQKLNQYTLIMDVLWGTEGPANFGSILQTHDFANPTDGDMFWRASDGFYGKGCCSLYDAVPGVSGTNHVRGQWARVAFSVDLASPTRKLAKYVNGQLHRQDLTGDGNALDSRFGLPPEFFLFGDGDDNERTDCYVNSIQILNRALTDEEVAALGGASADGIPTPNPVKGEWTFDGSTLASFIGPALNYIDNGLSNLYTFGTTTAYGIPDINGKPATVLHIPYTATADADGTGPIFKRIGLRTDHGMLPNGGGTKVNQWTLIMDVLWGTEGPANFGSILQTHDFANPTDGDMFWRASDGFYGKGCCSLYDAVPGVSGTNHVRGQWARVVFSVDLASPTRKLAKYVNGQLHRQDLTGDGNALDSRFGLPPQIFLFGDGDDNERTDCYVNNIQFREGAMTDEEVAALGGASHLGIPGAPAGGGAAPVVPPAPITLTVTRNGSNLLITWNGGPGVKLVTKAALSDAQWVDVPGTDGASSANIPITGAKAFYRALRQ